MKNNKNLLLLITPSWVVNVVGLAVGILLTGGVIVLGQFQGSELRQQLFDFQTNSAPTTSSYQTVTENLADNQFLGALPLLLTWACVGFVVYVFASAIVKSLGKAIELHDQLEYVHASRQSLMRQALLQLCIRAAAAIGWFVWIKVTLLFALPYVLSAAYAASQSFSLQNVGYAALAIVVAYATVCVHAIFLRLIALKPRLFGTQF